jgi:hypothetical protein
MEAGEDSVVIVGAAASSLLDAAAVKERTGSGEAAVVIPRSLLVEALKALQA